MISQKDDIINVHPTKILCENVCCFLAFEILNVTYGMPGHDYEQHIIEMDLTKYIRKVLGHFFFIALLLKIGVVF